MLEALTAQLPDASIFLGLLLAASLAGFVDAVVGGGGLITIPALLLGLPPGTPLPVLLGTNKVVSCTGTSFAMGHFLRSGTLRWKESLGPVVLAMLGSAAGAWATYHVRGDFMRPLMLALMLGMLAFVLLKPELGSVHAPKFDPRTQKFWEGLLALCVGAYDGFFGPGTGSLLIFAYVAFLGVDFLRATAMAKAVNWGSNVSAIVFFLSRGSWIPLLALGLAIGNAIGGTLGARVALHKGSAWVRWLFVVVVSALILRLGWQQFASR